MFPHILSDKDKKETLQGNSWNYFYESLHLYFFITDILMYFFERFTCSILKVGTVQSCLIILLQGTDYFLTSVSDLKFRHSVPNYYGISLFYTSCFRDAVSQKI